MAATSLPPCNKYFRLSLFKTIGGFDIIKAAYCFGYGRKISTPTRRLFFIAVMVAGQVISMIKVFSQVVRLWFGELIASYKLSRYLMLQMAQLSRLPELQQLIRYCHKVIPLIKEVTR